LITYFVRWIERTSNLLSVPHPSGCAPRPRCASPFGRPRLTGISDDSDELRKSDNLFTDLTASTRGLAFLTHHRMHQKMDIKIFKN
jgi:hypothetical protein